MLLKSYRCSQIRLEKLTLLRLEQDAWEIDMGNMGGTLFFEALFYLYCLSVELNLVRRLPWSC